MPICVEASQIRLDVTIQIAFMAALAVFSIAQFLRYTSEWGLLCMNYIRLVKKVII